MEKTSVVVISLKHYLMLIRYAVYFVRRKLEMCRNITAFSHNESALFYKCNQSLTCRTSSYIEITDKRVTDYVQNADAYRQLTQFTKESLKCKQHLITHRRCLLQHILSKHYCNGVHISKG